MLLHFDFRFSPKKKQKQKKKKNVLKNFGYGAKVDVVYVNRNFAAIINGMQWRLN